MTESTAGERIAHHWYLRPVLFVSDVQAALRFYIDKLGFEKKWDSGTVCQVNRGGCEIILCEESPPVRGAERRWHR
jgi:catechol 2,3-dioxygenase-like lactoylglutathione lyase family enzyme